MGTSKCELQLQYVAGSTEGVEHGLRAESTKRHCRVKGGGQNKESCRQVGLVRTRALESTKQSGVGTRKGQEKGQEKARRGQQHWRGFCTCDLLADAGKGPGTQPPLVSGGRLDNSRVGLYAGLGAAERVLMREIRIPHWQSLVKQKGEIKAKNECKLCHQEEPPHNQPSEDEDMGQQWGGKNHPRAMRILIKQRSLKRLHVIFNDTHFMYDPTLDEREGKKGSLMHMEGAWDKGLEPLQPFTSCMEVAENGGLVPLCSPLPGA
eukprot:1149480-Pelagomonas_calceolata.AAC.5